MKNIDEQLDEIVRYAAKVSEEHNIAAIRQIWLAPLPELLYLDELDISELNRSHLRCQNRMCSAAFLRKVRTFDNLSLFVRHDTAA